jgi:signal transduction histidine kinase
MSLRLFIVKDLAEANGGRVTVQSDPDRGTRIVVAFDPPDAGA